MESIYSRSWFSGTRREGEDKVVCTAFFIDNIFEQKASIVVRTKDFSIVSAQVETLRGLSEADHNCVHIFPNLNGLQILSGNVGKAVRESINYNPQGYQSNLLLNTIRTVALSRSFFIKELGYQDEDDYYRFWAVKLKDTCMYQSNQDKGVDTYRAKKEKLGFDDRSEALFNRMQNINILRLGGDILCNGSLVDTHHQMSVILRLNDNLEITEVNGTIVRSPHEICPEGTKALNRLIGVSFQKQNAPAKSIHKLVGGGDGCFHLSNLVLEIAESLDALQSQQK